MVVATEQESRKPAVTAVDIEEEDFEPVDKEILGRSTWTFLHTMAASYPISPSNSQATRTSRFMRDFAQLYPCVPCARSFQKIVAHHPPDEPARRGGLYFARWMCEVHNEVNEELGKDRFDCSRKSLTTRWGVCEGCAAHADDLDQFMKLTKLSGPPQ